MYTAPDCYPAPLTLQGATLYTNEGTACESSVDLSSIIPAPTPNLFRDDATTIDMDIWAYAVDLASAPTDSEIHLINPGGTYRMAQTILGNGIPPFPLGTHNLGDFSLHGNNVTFNIWDDWLGNATPSLPYLNDGVFWNLTAGPSYGGPVCVPTTKMRVTFINGG